MRILFVDDSKTMLNLGKGVLEEFGYPDVTLCESGRAAIDALGQGKYDLILLDWHMPGLSGMDVLRFVKNQDHLKGIPVIMLTAEDHPKSIESALQSGVDDYLLKPFNIEIFSEKVTRLLPNS